MLSTEDRLAILQLHARYCACLDTGDVKGWAHCFTVDGKFGVRNMHTGRAAIEAHGLIVLSRRRANPWANVQHWNGNIIVEGNADSAVATSYLAMIGKTRDSGALTIVAQGWYSDDLKKENDDWKFSSRRICFDTPPQDSIPKKS